MQPSLLLPLAAGKPYVDVGQPLFGNQWLALLVILAGIAVFLLVIAGIGRWLAATHPDTPKPVSAPVPAAAPVPVVTATPQGPSPEVLAAIAAAVSTVLGARARIAEVRLTATHPNIEALMQQWSLEGRRQIYSSHKLR
ncbi:MAG: hypothetical protein HZA31_03485 [Opitutae bacterium]|nr:hypothetical protein [Opitutae bacterium]